MRTHHSMILAAGLSILAAACGSAASPEVENEAAPVSQEDASTTTTGQADDSATEPGENAATTIRSTVEINGVELEYAVVTPDGYQPGDARPLLLTMPAGPQTPDIRDQFLASNWAPEAIKRGWVVVSPSAPDGVLFFQGSEALIPEFLDGIVAQYPPEGGKVHISGMSNGGISAFRIALANPDRFASVIAAPGFPRGDDMDALATLADIPVVLFVGENDDAAWVAGAQEAADRLDAAGGNVTLSIEPNEGHFPSTLSDGVRIFDLLDSYR